MRQRVHAMSCPHCGGRAMIRSSKTITPLVRQVYYRCDDDDCGHQFVGQLAIIHSTRASSRPNPTVQLPLRTAATLQAVAALPASASEPADFAVMLNNLDLPKEQPKAA